MFEIIIKLFRLKIAIFELELVSRINLSFEGYKQVAVSFQRKGAPENFFDDKFLYFALLAL